MDMSFETLPSGTVLIALSGRLDIQGAAAIDVRFAAVSAANKAVVVDLAGVTFMASMGLRTLILGAKSMRTKAGRMALYRPQPLVEEVLVTSGTTSLMPISHDLAEAEALARPAATA
jgi:anti-anti-sigma factor